MRTRISQPNQERKGLPSLLKRPGAKGPQPEASADRARRAHSRAGDCLFTPTDSQLLEDVVDMILDGRHLDIQPRCNLLVRKSLGDELENLRLASGQPLCRARALRGER